MFTIKQLRAMTVTELLRQQAILEPIARTSARANAQLRKIDTVLGEMFS